MRKQRVVLSYQWCMVGYLANLILTLVKLVFENDGNKLALHLIACYVNFVAAWSYYMMWTGFSPMSLDVGSCLWVDRGVLWRLSDVFVIYPT